MLIHANNSQHVRREGSLLNLKKGICQNLTRGISVNGEMLKAFLLRLRARRGCPLTLLLFSVLLEVKSQHKTIKRN